MAQRVLWRKIRLFCFHAVRAILSQCPELLPGEAAGWRPFLIFPPMAVETGAPVLISNLNHDVSMGDTRQLSFFQLFPDARATFRLGLSTMASAFCTDATLGLAAASPPTRVKV